MPSKRFLKAWTAAMVSVCLFGHGASTAQVVTLGQALSAPVAQQKAEAAKQEAPPRLPAAVHLDAIYGHSADLRASVYLNGMRQEVQAGSVLKDGSTACRVTRIELPARCVDVAQASKGGDICPARVCWTGERPPAPEPQTEERASTGKVGRDLGMPPTPVPHPEPARKQP